MSAATATPRVTKCPAGHRLTCVAGAVAAVDCDVCNTTLQVGASFFGCREGDCVYEVCPSCCGLEQSDYPGGGVGSPSRSAKRRRILPETALAEQAKDDLDGIPRYMIRKATVVTGVTDE